MPCLFLCLLSVFAKLIVRYLTEGLGKESADELIEQIATSNPCINDLDETNAQLPDQKEVIQNLFDYVAFDLGTHSIDGNEDYPDDEE